MFRSSPSFSTRLRALPLLATFGFASMLAFVPAAPIAHAQTAATVGVVDESKLADNDKELQKALDGFEKRAQEFDVKIGAREYLAEGEGKVFDTLIVLEKSAPAQQTQLDGLVTTGNNRRAEFLGLVGKANRTPADTTRLNELQGTASKNQSDLQRISQKMLLTLRKQQEDAVEVYLNKRQSVIAQIASEKKLVAVLRKEALMWSADSIDITDEVLKRLN